MSIHSYQYQACDLNGNVMSGQLNASSEREALAMLQAQQLVPVKLEESTKQIAKGNTKKIKNADLVDFTNGLCTLVEAAIPIDKALSLLEGISEKQQMKRLVALLRKDVKEGKGLADAMEAHPAAFSKMYINIIRAGETGGILDELLPELANSLERTEETRKQIISAMSYPLILAVMGIVSVLLLLLLVVPQFSVMFEDVGAQTPDSAVFLLSLSEGLKRYGWLIFPIILFIAYCWRVFNTDLSRRRKKDAFFLTVPLLGKLLVYKDVAIFSRTLGALLGAGIPLIRALRVAREVIVNEELIYHLGQVEEDVRGGAGLGLSLEKTGRFPILLHQLVAVGEESGRTSSILQKLAITFDTYVRDQMNRLVGALQPTLILLLGLMVGGIIVVMLSAVFSMNSVEF